MDDAATCSTLRPGILVNPSLRLPCAALLAVGEASSEPYPFPLQEVVAVVASCPAF